MSPINVGVLGFAHGHVDAYCTQWRTQLADQVRVAAGWDHDAQRLTKAKETHGFEPCATAAQLLARRDVQAVVIGAETSLHAQLVEQAAAAGRQIILQKPMALTMDEADRIVESVGRAQVPFTLAWQMRVDPQNLQIKQLLASGELGRVFMVRRRHGLSTHVWGAWFQESWHVKPELNRGMWADDAAHAIDFIYWLLGEPVSVMADIDTLHTPKVPDDQGIALFRYANGLFAEVVCSFTCCAGENTTEIVAEKGVIIQNYGDAPSCNVPRPADAVGLKWFSQAANQWTHSDIPSPPNHGHRIAALAAPLADFLHGRRDPIATARDGRTALKLTLACYESARLGKRLDLASCPTPSLSQR